MFDSIRPSIRNSVIKTLLIACVLVMSIPMKSQSDSPIQAACIRNALSGNISKSFEYLIHRSVAVSPAPPGDVAPKNLAECSSNIPMPTQDILEQDCYSRNSEGMCINGNCSKYLPDEKGQCVAYVRCRTGIYSYALPGGVAKNWKPNIKDPKDVKVGDIAIFTTKTLSNNRVEYPEGHVAYVEDVTLRNGKIMVRLSEMNYGRGAMPRFENLLTACGATSAYGKVQNSRVVDLIEINGIYRRDASISSNASSTAIPVLDTVDPNTHGTGIFQMEFRGKGFQKDSKVIAQGNGWSSQNAVVSFQDSTLLLVTMEAKNPSVSFTVSVINPDGKVSNTQSIQITGGSTGTTGTGSGVTLGAISPTSRPAGQISIDLTGSGFQSGAKAVIQGGSLSGDPTTIYMGPGHLRAIFQYSGPAHLSVAVRNPDGQISAAQPLEVTPGPAGSASSGNISNTTPRPNSGTTVANPPTPVNPPPGVQTSKPPAAVGLPPVQGTISPTLQPAVVPGNHPVSTTPSSIQGSSINLQGSSPNLQGGRPSPAPVPRIAVPQPRPSTNVSVTTPMGNVSPKPITAPAHTINSSASGTNVGMVPAGNPHTQPVPASQPTTKAGGPQNIPVSQPVVQNIPKNQYPPQNTNLPRGSAPPPTVTHPAPVVPIHSVPPTPAPVAKPAAVPPTPAPAPKPAPVPTTTIPPRGSAPVTNPPVKTSPPSPPPPAANANQTKPGEKKKP